jgi:hypothetical protein
MISLRSAAACALAFALFAGCQSKKVEADQRAPAVGPAAPDRVAAAKAAYAAMPGVIVGEVDGVAQNYAAVSGIDPNAVTKADSLSFIDVTENRIVNHGTLFDVTAAGRLIVAFETDHGDRAPRKGDLCVKLK